jgi:hypothetical protein
MPSPSSSSPLRTATAAFSPFIHRWAITKNLLLFVKLHLEGSEGRVSLLMQLMDHLSIPTEAFCGELNTNLGVGLLNPKIVSLAIFA